MLNEEVQFTHVRKAPENKLLELGMNAGGVVLALGGAYAGYQGMRHGFDFGKFWSFVLGAPVGLGLGIATIVGIEDAIKSPRQDRYLAEQSRLDAEAKENGAEVATFNYRGNDLECVMREEHHKGNIFYMSVNDDIIRDPLFSYQPNREGSLKFKFSTPDFGKTCLDSRDRFDLELNAISEGRSSDKAVREHNAALKERVRSGEKNIMEALHSIRENYAAKLHEGEELSLKLSKGGGVINTLLVYNGESYNSRLGVFSRCASELMNETYQQRAFVAS